ncbi:hypothetical protein ACFHWW_03475 [Ensifer sp. P24N7]
MVNTGQARSGEGETSLRRLDAALNRLKHLHETLLDRLQCLDSDNDQVSSLTAPPRTQRSECMVIVWPAARGHGDIGPRINAAPHLTAIQQKEQLHGARADSAMC